MKCRHITSNETYLKCPYSDVLYRRKFSVDGIYTTYSHQCPYDLFHYQACGIFNFKTEKFGLHDKLACGWYTCKFGKRNKTFSGLILNIKRGCNNVTECERGEDEIFCQNVDSSRSAIACDIFGFYDSSQRCDRKCDCKFFCEDEFNCDGFIYGYTCKNTTELVPPSYICDHIDDCPTKEDEESDVCNYKNSVNCSTMEGYGSLIVTNFSRCFPWVICDNKLDQTNCSNSALAKIICPVNGWNTSISKYSICNKNMMNVNNYMHFNTTAICDDGIDARCVSPFPECYIHKHQLCDGVTDCVGGVDESMLLCSDQTKERCVRRYGNKYLRLPVAWLNDGDVDCHDSLDEISALWPKCQYKHFTTIGKTVCADVFLCDNSYIGILDLCDRLVSCPKAEELCKSRVFRQANYPVNKKGTFYLSSCLPGIPPIMTCNRTTYPTSVLGAQTNNLYQPEQLQDCRYYFGEMYVFLSCTGGCLNASCPIQESVSGHSCSNNRHDKHYSITDEGNIVLVSVREQFRVSNVFECRNKLCLPYGKVCDLIDDCGDGSDEEYCSNNFICNQNSSTLNTNYIPVWKVCDGQFDCVDSSDELLCCENQIIKELPLKCFAWIIGILAVLLNATIITKNVISIHKIRTLTAYRDRLLIMFISFGDLMVGLYLLAIAATDYYFQESFCRDKFMWMVSLQCAVLGVISTFGGQVSLFSMTVLSLTRVLTLLQGLRISSEVNRRHATLIVLMCFLVSGASLCIALLPVLPSLEDIFDNALYFPGINFLKGFVNKRDLKKILASYYGRIKLNVSEFSWKTFRTLIREMFTDSYGTIKEFPLKFYGNDAVCLFKYFVSSGDSQTTYSWAVLGLNFLCFIVISTSYVIVNLISVRSTWRLTHATANKLSKKRNKRLQRKVSIIIATDFLCWVPFILISMLHTLEKIDASKWYALISIVILPINSVINPLLYDDSISLILKQIIAKITSTTVIREHNTVTVSEFNNNFNRDTPF